MQSRNQHCTSPVPLCPDYMAAFAVSLHGIRKQNTRGSGCNRSMGKAASTTASSSAASRSTRQCNLWWDCPAAPSNPYPSFREGPILFLIEPLGYSLLVSREGRGQWFGLDSLEIKKDLQYLESRLKSGMERKMTAPKIICFVGMGLAAKRVYSDVF